MVFGQREVTVMEAAVCFRSAITVFCTTLVHIKIIMMPGAQLLPILTRMESGASV